MSTELQVLDALIEPHGKIVFDWSHEKFLEVVQKEGTTC
jgi:hypothetical protein